MSLVHWYMPLRSTSRGWGLVQYQEVPMLAVMVWSLYIHAVTCAVWVPCDVATLMVNAYFKLLVVMPRGGFKFDCFFFWRGVRFIYILYILIHFASFCLLSYGTSLYLRPTVKPSTKLPRKPGCLSKVQLVVNGKERCPHLGFWTLWGDGFGKHISYRWKHEESWAYYFYI